MVRPVCTGAALSALAFLAACAPPDTPVKSIALLDNAVVATAPAGYCVDQVASKPARGFAVMAPCVNLGGSDSVPDVIAVATVQVGAPGSAALSDGAEPLRDLLQSERGATLLSGTGDATTIKIMSAETDDNSVVVNFSDSAPAPLSGLASDEWRAFFDLGSRLVTVSVRGVADTPMEDATGAWLLDLVVTGLLPGS